MMKLDSSELLILNPPKSSCSHREPVCVCLCQLPVRQPDIPTAESRGSASDIVVATVTDGESLHF